MSKVVLQNQVFNEWRRQWRRDQREKLMMLLAEKQCKKCGCKSCECSQCSCKTYDMLHFHHTITIIPWRRY
jgi:hypothetical protein